MRWDGRDDGSRRLSARGSSDCHRNGIRGWRCVCASGVGSRWRLGWWKRDRRVVGTGIGVGVGRLVLGRPPIENGRELPQRRRRIWPRTKLRLRSDPIGKVAVRHSGRELSITNAVIKRSRYRGRRVRRRIRIAFLIRKDNPSSNLKPVARSQHDVGLWCVHQSMRKRIVAGTHKIKTSFSRVSHRVEIDHVDT